MGRVGTGAYDELVQKRDDGVVGVDRDQDLVDRHVAAGRNVIRNDSLDRGFWERARLHSEIELVVAAMSSHAANLECVRRIREFLPDASIAAVAVFRDQVADLHEAGVDVARNLYEEAGQALADDAYTLLEDRE
jgi:Trk K+ transport system NAD-binding subunit